MFFSDYTDRYVRWGDPRRSDSSNFTHNTFPDEAYHQNHVVIPRDALYTVSGQVTFTGRVEE